MLKDCTRNFKRTLHAFYCLKVFNSDNSLFPCSRNMQVTSVEKLKMKKKSVFKIRNINLFHT